MRGISLCIIMALVPFASAISAPPINDDGYDFEIWYESVIVSQGRNWDSTMWQEVVDAGGYPIRTVDKEKLIVWLTDDFEINPEWSLHGSD